MAVNFYEFRERWEGDGPIICIGPSRIVYEVLPREELIAVFGGYAVYVDDNTGDEYVGIWSARKASRFRQMLRKRGVAITLRRGFLPSFRPKIRSSR